MNSVRLICYVLLICAAGCDDGARPSSAISEPQPASHAAVGDKLRDLESRVSGEWTLKEWGGESPRALNIKELVFRFKKGGIWEYEATMTGTYEGMMMKGSGTWAIEGDSFVYKAGDNGGRSHVTIIDGILGLDPDPIVFKEGKTRGKGLYIRRGA
jgi:hypothetical protein